MNTENVSAGKKPEGFTEGGGFVLGMMPLSE